MLPRSTTKAQAVAVFRNHDTLIRLDPELKEYEACPPPEGAKENTKFYKITDIMHTLPKGLWDTTVSFTAEITDIENGVYWVVKAPLGLVQQSTWTVEPAGEKDEVETSGGKEERLVLVEDVDITCNRILMGTVKGKCEENWKGVHARWIEHLKKMAA